MANLASYQPETPLDPSKHIYLPIYLFVVRKISCFIIFIHSYYASDVLIYHKLKKEKYKKIHCSTTSNYYSYVVTCPFFPENFKKVALPALQLTYWKQKQMKSFLTCPTDFYKNIIKTPSIIY